MELCAANRGLMLSRKKAHDSVQRLCPKVVPLEQDLMARAFNDQRFIPFTRVTRNGHGLTKSKMRPVIDDTVFACLQ